MKSIEFKYFVTRLNKRLDEYIVPSGEQYQLCIDMLMQALDTATWNEFIYLFGKIIYGITNDCDRKLCRTYPGIYVNPNLVILKMCIVIHSVRFNNILLFECIVWTRYFIFNKYWMYWWFIVFRMSYTAWT